MKKFLLAFLAAGMLAGALHGLDSQEGIIRIGVLENARSFNLGCEGGLVLVELNSGRTLKLDARTVYMVAASAKGVSVAGKILKPPLRMTSSDKGKYIRINGKRYRDAFLIKKSSKGGIHVINELGLDGYVFGILPQEVGRTWPLEALKAQAVASRSFALHNLHRHDAEGFHLCATVHCQVYGGLDGEKEQTSRAVDQTHNEILLYKGEPANTFFFSNCGGKTEDPRNAWENSSAPPYLRAVRCKYCRQGGHYEWERSVSEDDLLQALIKNHYPAVPPIRVIRVASIDSSGRAKLMIVRHAGGEFKIRSGKFRMMLGPDVVRSTFFSNIKRTRDGFTLQGKGWGHGVGMCQEGARGYALKGAGYRKILQFYYFGTKLKKFKD